MSFFSGIVDARDHIRLGGYAVPFRVLLGLLIEDFVPMSTGEINRLDTEDGTFECDLWADLVHLEAAESLASYTRGFYTGTPAVTRNAFGRGVPHYVGTRLEQRYTGLLVQRVCEQAGVEPTLRAPPKLDAVRRKTDDASFLFLLNHDKKAVEVSLPGPGRDLLSGGEHDSTLVLGPLEVAVLRASPKGSSGVP